MYHCYSVTIVGKVQGVGFRYWLSRRAVHLEIKGWVKNCPDGSVKACLEGTLPEIQQLINECAHGPPNASVLNVSTSVEPRADFVSFQIIP